jgi:geranylgeranylglycerol-phosphate geranylgeranyltransferase
MKLLKQLFIFFNIKNSQALLQPVKNSQTLLQPVEQALLQPVNIQDKVPSLLEHLFKPSLKVHSLPPLPPPNKNKFESILELIRVNHIPPTLFLCFSGAFIINPSLSNLLQPSFIVSTLDIILLMSASMVINDIYDIETDKINKPHRPIVTGAITKIEAINIAFILLGTSEYLSLHFLSENLHNIIHLTILYINLYTPILKKIFIIKNISCALIVSFSIFFTALATSKYPLIIHPNLELLIVACNLVFTGSWSNEILLDIRDYEGDKKENIQTLPVVLGKETAWTCSLLVLTTGIAVNILKLYQITNINVVILFILMMMPQLNDLYIIKKTSFSDNSIEKYMDQTNKTLFFILLLLSIHPFHLFHL